MVRDEMEDITERLEGQVGVPDTKADTRPPPGLESDSRQEGTEGSSDPELARAERARRRYHHLHAKVSKLRKSISCVGLGARQWRPLGVGSHCLFSHVHVGKRMRLDCVSICCCGQCGQTWST